MTTTRLLREADATALADVLVRSRDFLAPWEPVRPDSYFTPQGQAQAIAESLHRHAEGSMHPLVILDESRAVVGRINLNTIVRGAFQSASVGYWLDQAANGRGLATAALAEVVGIAFGELGLHRLEAGTIPGNVRSQAVLLRNGFTRLGYAPRYLNIAGSYTDHILFQRLADE